MKLDSKIFDRIRVKPDKERTDADVHPHCEWEDCDRPAPHRAPKGRHREGQYFNFCLEHVRQYNKSYNYFSGMDNDSVASFIKSSSTGHRPTWKMGINRGTDADQATLSDDKRDWTAPKHDPFELFRGTHSYRPETRQERRQRRMTEAQKNAFDVLKLDVSVDKTEIKTRFKELVKRHHPDANGGDRSSEERLRQIIQAYNVLKQAGFC